MISMNSRSGVNCVHTIQVLIIPRRDDVKRHWAMGIRRAVVFAFADRQNVSIKIFFYFLFFISPPSSRREVRFTRNVNFITLARCKQLLLRVFGCFETRINIYTFKVKTVCYTSIYYTRTWKIYV